MVNAQEWLDQNYPKEIRNSIRNLYANNKNLEGCLDLQSFINLEKIDCSNNQLTKLDLTNLNHLEKINCDNNYLTGFNYSDLNPDKLTWLSITNNNLSEQNLSCFGHLVNLEYLWIGNNDKERIEKGIYNRFYGSPEVLRNLTKLERFHPQNTYIQMENGLNYIYLPGSIRRIRNSIKKNSKSKADETSEQKNYFLRWENDEDWKKIHPKFDEWKQGEWERLGFNYEETKQWVEVGLQPNDYHFATYLKGEGYNPYSNLNLQKLKMESENPLKWLEEKYPEKEKKWVTWIEVSKKGLKGDLIIKDFPNLEKIDCWKNNLSTYR